MATAEDARVGGRPLVLRPAALPEIIALRHAVLRAGLPREAADFEGDGAPATRHFGAFDGVEAVGCVSLMRVDRDGHAAYQLRGMATRADVRSRGLGRLLLDFAERALVRETGVRSLWCNARLPAVRFYERHGWRVASEPFDIPTAGPHCVMTRDVV
jgi:GNAT superfamily N-acetyltransferase